MFLSKDSSTFDQFSDFDERSFRKFVLSLYHSLEISPEMNEVPERYIEQNEDYPERRNVFIEENHMEDFNMEEIKEGEVDEFAESLNKC